MKIVVAKKSKCPYCGRPMSRSVVALAQEPFCPRCLEERLKASGADKVPESAVLVVDSTGYAQFKW